MIIKPRTQILLILAAFIAGFAVFGLRPLLGHTPGAQSALPHSPHAQPSEGWIVCEDLSFGPVPGIPEWRQRFRLCHPDGWEYLTFCLQPGWPMPPLGTSCTEIGDGIFSCGDFVQSLQLYQVITTPTPPPPTATPRPTITATPTRRPRVNTPPPPETTPPGGITTPFPNRPHPGGSGNRGWLVLLVISSAALFVLQAAGALFLLRRK